MSVREFKCKSCSAPITAYDGRDVDCGRCDQTHNCFGQRIDFPRGRDEAYAGERWEED